MVIGLAIVLALALILGLVLGLRARQSTKTSDSSVPSNIITIQSGAPSVILNNTAFAAAQFSNSDKFVFFLDVQNQLNWATSSADSWTSVVAVPSSAIPASRNDSSLAAVVSSGDGLEFVGSA